MKTILYLLLAFLSSSLYALSPSHSVVRSGHIDGSVADLLAKDDAKYLTLHTTKRKGVGVIDFYFQSNKDLRVPIVNIKFKVLDQNSYRIKVRKGRSWEAVADLRAFSSGKFHDAQFKLAGPLNDYLSSKGTLRLQVYSRRNASNIIFDYLNLSFQTQESTEVPAPAPEPEPAPSDNGYLSSIFIQSGSMNSYTDAAGVVWQSDRYVSGGDIVDRGASVAIENTNSDRLYQTERWGPSQYKVPVENGTYTVKLHFAETNQYYFAGKRVFGVNVENKSLSNIDVFSEAGGLYKAIIKTISEVSVNDSTLNIDFIGGLDNPIINAIEIHKTSETPLDPSVTTESPAPAPEVAPTVPQNLVSSNITYSSVMLSFSASSDSDGILGYKVYRDGSYLATSTATTYTDTGLRASTTYTYAVRALDNKSNESGLSSTITVKTLSAPTQSGALLPPYLPLPLYSKDSVWNTPIPANPAIDPDSGAMVQALVKATRETYDPILNMRTWSVPVYVADAKTPRYDVAITGSNTKYGFQAMVNVPIPSNAKPDPQRDGHMVIMDISTGYEYDFWQAKKHADGSWSTSWGNRIALDSNGIFPTGSGAKASGFAAMAGIIWPEEFKQGRIDHALFMALPIAAAGGFVPPATASDGWVTTPGAIPEGAHLQLDPNLDLSKFNMTSYERIIAKALQQYGAYVGDYSGAVSLYAINPQSWPTDPYPAEMFPSSLNYLKGIPWEHMRILKFPKEPGWGPTGVADFSIYRMAN